MAKEIQEFQAKVTADTKQATKDVEDLTKKLDAVEKGDTTAKVHGSGADKLLADLHEVATAADDVDQSDPKVAVSITGADEAAGKLHGVADAADHAGERADAQTGGLRDISGALGDIGGTGLDAADGLIGFSETITQVAPQLAGFASGLGAIGLAVGVGSLLYAGLQALPGLLNNASDAEKIAEAQTKTLSDAFKEAGPSVAAFNKTLVDYLAANPETVAAMNMLGVSAGDISDVVNGQTSPSIDNARKFLDAYTLSASKARDETAAGKPVTEDFAAAMGLTTDQANNMAAAAKTIISTVDGQKTAMQTATAQTDAFNTALRGLPGTVPIEIKASDGGSLQEILDRYNQIKSKQITIDAVGHLHAGGAGAMAGTPYAPGGPMRVGEAGPETVYLPRGSRVDTAGRTMMNDQGGGQTIVNNYSITVNVPVGTPTPEVGRFVADALDAHERRSGSRRRVA